MNAHGNDIEQIKELVMEQKRDGNTIIAFPDGLDTFSLDELHFFSNAYDASEFCYENSTDRDHYRIATSETVLELLSTGENENKSIHQKTKIMNTQNLDYLKESLKYSGFDTQLNAELEKCITEQSPDFQLKHATKIGGDDMEYALHFRKGEQNEMYFFNRMDATLKKPGENEQGISQTFYANQHISAKEAYNLLDGRAVQTKLSYKDDIKKTYEAWVQLDFSKQDKHNNYEVEKFTEKYGFKVEDKVKELALNENSDAQANERLVKSLKRGNLTEATWERDGVSEKVFLSANPKEWSLNAYDENMNKLGTDDLKLNTKAKQEGVAENTSDDVKKNQRQKQENEPTAKRPSRKIKA